MAKDSASYIGEGAEFNGKLYTKGHIKINGKFEGELKADELIHIGPTGKIKTNISSKKAIIEGTILGNINTTEEVVITETGRVMGDITTPHLQLGKGVVVNGKINITGGQAKNSKQIFTEVFDEKDLKKAGLAEGGNNDDGKGKKLFGKKK